MPNIAHSTLTDPELHEPKGVAAATINQVYSANGAGAGVWQKITNTNLSGVTVNATAGQSVVADGAGGFLIESTDHASVAFVNTAAPYTIAATTSFAKATPTTTVSGHAQEFTEGTNARITYLGNHTEHIGVSCHVSFDQSTGSNKDVSFAIAVNGVVIALSEQITTTTSAIKQSMSVYTDVQMGLNDYVEVFVKVSANCTVSIYAFNLIVEKF